MQCGCSPEWRTQYPAATRLQRSQPPLLVGVIESPAGVTGHMTIAHVLSQRLNGAYKLVITVQRHRSLRTPGAVVLAGYIDS